jgi:transposase-like protein
VLREVLERDDDHSGDHCDREQQDEEDQRPESNGDQHRRVRDPGPQSEPKIVAKRQKRLSGVDELVILLSAKGLTSGEAQAHLAEVYGVEVSRQMIFAVVDEVFEGWPSDRTGRPWARLALPGYRVDLALGADLDTA